MLNYYEAMMMFNYILYSFEIEWKEIEMKKK